MAGPAEMKPRPLLLLFCINCFICVSYTVNPACECVVFQSYGRSQGTFTSPNFPAFYPSNINCILYTFIGDLDEIVELTFLEFDLNVPITNKCTDFLKFFLDLERPEVNERKSWNYELCGNISMIQKKHYSSERSMILEFHTDSIPGNHTGFRGIFKFLDKQQFAIQGGIKRWGSKCTIDFYSDTSDRGSKRGQFFSPKYPQNYPPKANCQYVFYGLEGERVKVTFRNIQLENIDGSCTESPDFIVVRDGVDTTSTVIAQYCNTLNNEEITSSGINLYIEFIVDGKKQRQGFAASFEFVPANTLVPEKPVKPEPGHKENGHMLNGPGGRGGSGHQNTHSPGDSPVFVGPTTPSPKPTDCIQEYHSSAAKNGTFHSPRFPLEYPAETTCRYSFRGIGKERVQVIFTELDLYYPEGNPEDPFDCEDVDSVTVSIFIGGENKEIGVYCGTKTPPMLMSNENRMEVTMTSRSPQSISKGFKAIYRFVTDFGIDTGKQDPQVVCGFLFKSEEAPNGTFTSPNFPGLYPRNTECHYLFYGKEKEKVYITFPYFDVEGIRPSCIEDTMSDYVEFSNFNIKLKDRKMSRFCGSQNDDPMKSVNSDGNFFRVTFKSNDVYDATGFEAFYQFRKYEDPFSPHKRVNKAAAPCWKSSTLLQMSLLVFSLCLSTLMS